MTKAKALIALLFSTVFIVLMLVIATPPPKREPLK